MNKTITNVRRQLKENSDAAVRESGKRFFKEEITLYGVKSALAGKIAKAGFQELKGTAKADIFRLCDELWSSGYIEESFVACSWAYELREEYRPEDFKVFESWVAQYVSNWASCDTLCNHTIGTFIEMYPQFIKELKRWALSENRWVRRASAVTLIIPARRGKFLKEILELSDILLTDEDDMVRKGYGWLLKAASEAHQAEVFAYVMARKADMPRTALRYAIEKMPPAMRTRAMSK